jgi:serine/threonine protein phosphatase PrpC
MIGNGVAPKMVFFGLSDLGLKRTNNEDHFLVAELSRKVLGVKDNRVIPRMIYHEVGPRGTLLAVADGLGGHEDGEVASRMAVETVAQKLFATEVMHCPPTPQLMRAVEEAHQVICQHHSDTAHSGGMSSTLTAVHIGYEVMTIAQVGDSRAYLFSHGKLTLLTEDQTVVHMLQKKGVLTDEEASTHPDRHVVWQALGQNRKVTPEIQCVPFQDGDSILLCTDGLSSYVPHEKIEQILNTERDENMRCQRLIDEANATGGVDNVTVLLARLFH